MTTTLETRRAALRLGLIVEGASILWMVVEAAVAIEVALATRSGATLAFGVDSLIEIGSAGVLVWRLRAEQAGPSGINIERVEWVAGRIVGGALYALAGFVVLAALATLVLRVEPTPSKAGLALAVASLVIMPILAGLKRRIAVRLDSAALRGDAACSITCAYLAATLLVGLALNLLLGWWWADPLAAVGIVYFLLQEAREAWAGDDCCED